MAYKSSVQPARLPTVCARRPINTHASSASTTPSDGARACSSASVRVTAAPGHGSPCTGSEAPLAVPASGREAIAAITLRMKRVAALALVVLACAGCASSAAGPKGAAPPKKACTAAQLAGWKKLARRIHAAVYCPSWLPDPLDGVIGSRWNNIDEVSRDGSYLESWVWQETGPGAAGGELHVNR